GPLLMRGTLEGHPVVSMTFDPSVSGLEKSLAFPLLVSNATSYLLAQAETPATASTVEPFDRAESDIRPRPLPTFKSGAPPDLSVDTPFSERWIWLAAGALALLGLEWLVFARRG